MAAGRRSKPQEHLDSLIDWAGGHAKFKSLTGIRKADQLHYVAGTKTITMKRVRRAAEEVFGVPPAFVPLVEREPVPATIPAALAGRAGAYAFFSSAGSLIYFGKATNLRLEIAQTLARYTPSTLVSGVAKRKYKFRGLAAYYSAYETPRGDTSFRHDLEALVIRVTRRDTLNTQGAHFKRDE